MSEKEKAPKKDDDELTLQEVMAVGLLGLVEDLGMLRDNQVREHYELGPAYGEDSWSPSSIRFRKLLEDRGIL